MAGTESGEHVHHIQKSPAAAQKPPNLRALEVKNLGLCLNFPFTLSLNLQRSIFHLRALLSRRACQGDLLVFVEDPSQFLQLIVMAVQVKTNSDKHVKLLIEFKICNLELVSFVVGGNSAVRVRRYTFKTIWTVFSIKCVRYFNSILVFPTFTGVKYFEKFFLVLTNYI